MKRWRLKLDLLPYNCHLGLTTFSYEVPPFQRGVPKLAWLVMHQFRLRQIFESHECNQTQFILPSRGAVQDPVRSHDFSLMLPLSTLNRGSRSLSVEGRFTVDSPQKSERRTQHS